MSKLQFKKTRKVKNPVRGTSGSCGIDFFVPDETKECLLLPGGSINIASGIECKIPENHALIAFNKSGVALKKSLQVGACVIDYDYEGEIHLHVTNISRECQTVNPGDKLVQFLLIPVDYNKFDIVNNIKRENKSERKTGNFGSTGNK